MRNLFITLLQVLPLKHNLPRKHITARVRQRTQTDKSCAHILCASFVVIESNGDQDTKLVSLQVLFAFLVSYASNVLSYCPIERR